MNQSIVLAPPPGQIAPTAGTRVPHTTADRVDAGALIAFLRRRWPLMLALTLGSLAAGFVISARQTPTYLSTADVTLDPKVAPVAPLTDEDRLAAQGAMGETWIDTQVEEMASSRNVAAVVKRLDLARDPRFLVEGATQKQARDAAIAYVEGGVTTARTGATYTLSISFESEDAREAARVANAFAEQYTQGSVTEKEAADARSLKEIGSRMEQARRQASDDAAALARYRLAYNLPSTSDRSLTEQEISAYNQEVTSARAQAAEDAARLAIARQQLGSGSSGEDVGETLGSPVIGSLRQQQALHAAEIASLSSKYGPRHPDLQRARSQLQAVDAQIRDEIGRVISNLSARAAVSQRRAESLSGSLQASEGALRRDNIAMVALQDLEQRAQASRQLYESYLGRHRELAARSGIRRPEARVLHPAQPSDVPARPNILLNLTLAGAIGVGLGLICALFAELQFSGFSSGEEVEQRLGLNYLCSIPELASVTSRKARGNPVDAVIDQPRSAFAEAFRNLRTSIAFSVESPKIIAITSALPSEGKTTVALCLARSMAEACDAILLIDCDVRRRGVSRWIGSPRAVGLLEVLRGEASLEEAVVTDPRTGLAILPLSAAQEDHALLTGPAMDALLARAAPAFDAIIMDTAPVLPMADARLLLGKADAAVIATRWRHTPEAAIRSLLRLLPGGAVGLAGLILTRVNVRKQAAFGLDENAFYKAYKSYYA
ncbi:GumC family protein [Novosphingobium panipatense]|uniref:non-specific protein-tyrosine kinase n=1 Tax=Novosphingobium panipatense TaxID=428991 RepID=A0ABY1QJ15_9SPHN|nr:AAA family ATPase [Novosphingobium panipatense]SMP70022.1 capsular exopolysaccharide family [Novosphingobium panipatense]